MSEDCKPTIARHGEDLAALKERTQALTEAAKALQSEKLDRREREPVTWQIRTVIVAAISVMGSLILYVLTKAEL